MKRYRLENHVADSPTTYNILGPDGYAVAGMFNRDIPEGARLRAYIEAHDEVMNFLEEIVYQRGAGRRRDALMDKADELLARIEGIEGEEE